MCFPQDMKGPLGLLAGSTGVEQLFDLAQSRFDL